MSFRSSTKSNPCAQIPRRFTGLDLALAQYNN
jgi:hypothetical protein